MIRQHHQPTNKHKYFHGYNTLYKLLYLSLIDKAPKREYCASLIENVFEYLRLAYYNMVGITLRETGKKIIDKDLYKYDRLKYIVNILKEKKCIVHWKKSNKESVTFNVLLLGEISNFNKQFDEVMHYYNKIVLKITILDADDGLFSYVLTVNNEIHNGTPKTDKDIVKMLLELPKTNFGQKTLIRPELCKKFIYKHIVNMCDELIEKHGEVSTCKCCLCTENKTKYICERCEKIIKEIKKLTYNKQSGKSQYNKERRSIIDSILRKKNVSERCKKLQSMVYESIEAKKNPNKKEINKLQNLIKETYV